MKNGTNLLRKHYCPKCIFGILCNASKEMGGKNISECHKYRFNTDGDMLCERRCKEFLEVVDLVSIIFFSLLVNSWSQPQLDNIIMKPQYGWMCQCHQHQPKTPHIGCDFNKKQIKGNCACTGWQTKSNTHFLHTLTLPPCTHSDNSNHGNTVWRLLGKITFPFSKAKKEHTNNSKGQTPI